MITIVLPHLFLRKYYRCTTAGKGFLPDCDISRETEISGLAFAMIIKKLQIEPYLLSFLGGITGKYIRKMLCKNKIDGEFIFTRRNTEIKYENNKKLNFCTFDNSELIDKQYEQFKHKIKNLESTSGVVVIDQTYFKVAEKKFSKEVIKKFSDSHYKIILNLEDSEFELNELGDAVLYTIRILINKSNNFWGRKNEEIIAKYKAAMPNKVHYLVIEVEEIGVLFLSKNKSCFMSFESHFDTDYYNEAKETFIGAMAVGVSRKYECERIFKIAFASAISVYQNKGIMNFTQREIMKNKNKYVLSEIKVIKNK